MARGATQRVATAAATPENEVQVSEQWPLR
eukprot:COSAG01_NODE_15407_length_1341_cov_13.966989_2_plen_29_part_01